MILKTVLKESKKFVEEEMNVYFELFQLFSVSVFCFVLGSYLLRVSTGCPYFWPEKKKNGQTKKKNDTKGDTEIYEFTIEERTRLWELLSYYEKTGTGNIRKLDVLVDLLKHSDIGAIDQTQVAYFYDLVGIASGSAVSFPA